MSTSHGGALYLREVQQPLTQKPDKLTCRSRLARPFTGFLYGANRYETIDQCVEVVEQLPPLESELQDGDIVVAVKAIGS